MNGLVQFTNYQAEALLLCLAGSLIWAGVLFFGARGLERADAATSAEKLWTSALLFAVLPSLIAPTLAAFGVSLRPAPAPVEFESMRLAASSASQLIDAAATAGPAKMTAEQAIGAAALLYVYGVILSFVLWAARQAALHYALARAEYVQAQGLLRRIESWADDFNVPMPTLKRSRHVSSVCITGIFRQTVLIPHDIESRVSTDDLVLMCAHELAHIRRGDTRLFTATQLARVLFWFNPLVSRIAAHAELAAEESADALVLTKGVDRRAYAACFVEGLKFAAFRMNVQPALAPSFTPSDRHGRRRRLNSILSPETSHRTPLAKRLMLSAATSTVALVALGQAALAVDPDSAAQRRAVLNEMPLLGEITSGFGEKPALSGGKEGPAHNGLDIKAPKGAKIFAPGDGVVVEATDRYNGAPDWGKVVVIDHGHGLVTRYAHLDSYSVRKGDRVKTGDVIAAVGATGKVTGPHLHFETLKEGAPVDPAGVVAVADIEAADAAPAISPVDPVDPPEPAEAAAPVIEIAPAAKPAPASPPAPDAPGEGGAFSNSRQFAFAGDHPVVVMAEDMEKRLFGAANGEDVGSFNLTFKDGDKVFRFSSDEPLTAEKRAELREALKAMRKNSDAARKTAEKFRADAEKNRENWRVEMARVTADNAARAPRGADIDFTLSAEDIAQIRRDAQMSRRDALEMEREALEEARSDLDGEIEIDLEDALSDLDDAEADLEDADLSGEEIASAKAAIREQRRQLQRDGDVHKRAIDSARRQIERRIETIDRMIEELADEA